MVHIESIHEYYDFEQELKKCGFVNCTDKGAPICRYRHDDLLFDLMPDNKDILGFSNRWYSEGLEYAHPITLPNGIIIKILPVAFYIGSKLEAFSSRGNDDYLMSHDLEDVISLIRGLKDPPSIIAGVPELQNYLKSFFRKHIRKESFIDYLYGEYPGTPQGRHEAEKLVACFRSL